MHKYYIYSKYKSNIIEQVIDFNRKVFLPHIPAQIYEILDNAESRRKLYKREVFK